MLYGVDVASQRLDDLDKRVLALVATKIVQKESVSILDVGSGQGGLSQAVAGLGAQVTALDIVDYSNTYIDAAGRVIDFVQADIREWIQTITKHFDIVVLQRVLHYLPYHDAVTVLTALTKIADTLFLSMTGSKTAIADHYAVMDEPLSTRWGVLDQLGQEFFSITAPVCLYSEDEVLELLRKAGWNILWSRVSDFGNIKITAQSTNII